MDSDVVAAFRSRGFAVMTALDAGLIGRSDEEHLSFATQQGCPLYSFNISDFYLLHTRWVNAGREHGGVILSRQRLPVGEQLRRMLRLRASMTIAAMRNTVEFFSNRNR